MATAQVNPNPAPRRRSFFGPVVLIAVGVVFLLINQGKITPKAAFVWFADWWPALLIVWGLFKLFDYYQAQREGVPYRGIGGGGWVFLVFLIMTGLSFSGARRVGERIDPSDWDIVFDDKDFGDIFGGQKHEFTDTMEQTFPSGASLKAIVEHGNITVAPSSDDKLHVSLKKTVYADSEGDAQATAKSIAPTISVVDKIVTVDGSRKNDNKSWRLDLEILAPRKAALDLLSIRGNIVVRDREGEVKAAASKGGVTLEQIAGNCTVHMRGGDFDARGIKGDVSLDGRGGEVSANNVSGVLNVDGEYNSLRMEKIAKGVRFKSSRTDFEVARLDGSISLDLGDMRGNNMAGPLRLETRSKDIHLDDVSGDLRIANQNGEVEVSPHAPFGNLDIQNKKGTLRIGVPAGVGYVVDARARRGDLESDFDLSRSEDRGETHATGTIGKGGLKLQLNNEYGTIEIRKGALASAPEVPSVPRGLRGPNDSDFSAPAREAQKAAQELKKEAQQAAKEARKAAEDLKKEAETAKKDKDDEL